MAEWTPERAGQVVKQILEKVIEDHGILTTEEFDMALAAMVESRNRCVTRSGFSPRQLVVGSSRRLP
eukprot:8471990-Pyramimonas_sp.AAC.1